MISSSGHWIYYMLFCLFVFRGFVVADDSFDATKKQSFIPTRRKEATTTTSLNTIATEEDYDISSSHTENPISKRRRIKSITRSCRNLFDLKRNKTTQEENNDYLSSVSFGPDHAKEKDNRFKSSIVLKDSFYRKKEDLTNMVRYSKETLTTTDLSYANIVCRISAYMVGMQSIRTILLHHNTTVFEVRSSKCIFLIILILFKSQLYIPTWQYTHTHT